MTGAGAVIPSSRGRRRPSMAGYGLVAWSVWFSARRSAQGLSPVRDGGTGLPAPMLETRHQLLLGDHAFVERHWQTKNPEEPWEVSKTHRRSVAWSLDEYRMRHPDRDRAIAQVYLSGACTMAEIGRHFEVHYMTVSRAVRRFEEYRKTML